MLKGFRVFHFNDSQWLWGQNQNKQWTVPHDETKVRTQYKNTRETCRSPSYFDSSDPSACTFYLSPKFEIKKN